jgi:hypothetical protein
MAVSLQVMRIPLRPLLVVLTDNWVSADDINMPGPSGDVIASSWLCASDEDLPASVASPQVDMIAGAWECASD